MMSQKREGKSRSVVDRTSALRGAEHDLLDMAGQSRTPRETQLQ